jgi:hypothetical protein
MNDEMSQSEKTERSRLDWGSPFIDEPVEPPVVLPPYFYDRLQRSPLRLAPKRPLVGPDPLGPLLYSAGARR